MRTQRHAVLTDLLNRGLVRSQNEARKLLAKSGFRTTQATISRDFEELGVIKTYDEHGGRYALSGNSSEYGASLSKVLKEYVISELACGNLAVLRTPPGHASIVAAAIDRERIHDVLGTIAGDDTLFICVAEQSNGRILIDRLRKLKKGLS